MSSTYTDVCPTQQLRKGVRGRVVKAVQSWRNEMDLELSRHVTSALTDRNVRARVWDVVIFQVNLPVQRKLFPRV
jgi:hypothetical protein